MKYSNPIALRELRIQEKAIKARIDEIIDAATEEAVAVLAAQGLDRGEFIIELNPDKQPDEIKLVLKVV